MSTLRASSETGVDVDSILDISPENSESVPRMPVMAPAMALPEFLMRSVAPWIGAVMFSTPMASMQAATDLVTLFCKLAMDVAMPAVPVFACWANESKPAYPFLSRDMNASSRSSTLTFPVLSAL